MKKAKKLKNNEFKQKNNNELGKKNLMNKKVKITTGPFQVPLEVDSEIQVGRENDRLIITLKNPTSDKKLKACIKLGVCLQPEREDSISDIDDELLVFQDIPEIEVDLGKYVLKPHTCTRIERNIPGEIGFGTDERNATYRVIAKGHFNISKKGYQPIGGLLEISVICGSIFNPEEPGIEQADPATFFRYKDFVFYDDYYDD